MTSALNEVYQNNHLTTKVVSSFKSCLQSNALLKIQKKLAGRGCSHLQSQHFGMPRPADHLRSGVRDQPGQYGENSFLLKIQKLAGRDGGHL